MLGWFKSALNSVTSIFSSDPIPEFRTPDLKINFHTNQLIPSTIKAQEYPSWVGAYLKELPNMSVLLWLHQNQLQFSYSQNGQVKHIALPQFTLNAQTQCIQREDKNVSLKDIVDSLNQDQLINPLRFVDADALSDLKFKVQFAQKFISEELLTHIKTNTQRSLHNLENSIQCSICMDDYSNETPPYLVLGTASVYHFDCLDENRRSRGVQPFKDPKDNTLLGHRSDLLDLNQVAKKDLAYLSAIEDVKSLKERTKQLSKALDILVQKNKELEAKVAAIPAPAAPVVIVQPVSSKSVAAAEGVARLLREHNEGQDVKSSNVSRVTKKRTASKKR